MLLERFSFTKFGRKKFLNNQVLTRTDHSPEKRNLININVIFQHINSAKRTEIFDFFKFKLKGSHVNDDKEKSDSMTPSSTDF